MNILFICDEYPPQKNGGIGTFVQLLANELSKKKHNIVIYGLTDINEGEEKKCKVENNITIIRDYYNLKLPTFKILFINKILNKFFSFIILFFSYYKYQKKIAMLIKQHDIDIIEIPDWDSKIIKNPFLQFINKNLPIPYVVRLHGSYSFIQFENKFKSNPLIISKENKLYQNAEAIISVSQYGLKKYTNYYKGFPKNIVTVIPNGISSNCETKEHKYIDSYDFVFFGTLTRIKGIYTLIKAWNILCENNDKIKLHIFGKGDTISIEELLTKKASLQTFFYGHVERNELQKKLSEFDIAILPSYSETFGLAAIEAMNAGLTTIFTERSTGPEIINHNVDGLLVNPDSPEDIVEKIKLLMDNPEHRIEISKKGQERARSFTIENTAQLSIDLYEKVIINVK